MVADLESSELVVESVEAGMADVGMAPYSRVVIELK